jgi:hypothetical protein
MLQMVCWNSKMFAMYMLYSTELVEQQLLGGIMNRQINELHGLHSAEALVCYARRRVWHSGTDGVRLIPWIWWPFLLEDLV